VHAVILSLQFGIPGLGMPNFKPPPVMRIIQLAPVSKPTPPVPEPVPLEPIAVAPPPPLAPAAPRQGMTVVAPQKKVRPPMRKAPVPQKKAITAPRKSTPLPALEEGSVATRVIAQDASKDSAFNVPVPVPPEAEQKVLDKLEAQQGSDKQSADVAGAAKAETERLAEQAEVKLQEELAAAKQAEQAKAKRLADAQAQERLQAAKLREEAKQRDEAAAVRKAAEDQARQQAALRQQQEETALRKAAEEQKALKVAEEQKAKKAAEDLTARKLAEEQAARKVAEDLAVRKAAEEQATRKAAEELAARKLVEEKAARQLAEQKAADAKAIQDAAAKQPAQETAARQQAQEAARQAQEAAARQQAQEAAARQAAQQAVPGSGSGGSGGGNVARPAVPGDLVSRLRDQVKGLDVLRGTPPPPQPEGDRGRRRLVAGRIERDIPIRMYADSWRQKIERNGALNYSQLARERARNDPLVSVAIRSDGSVEDVTIVQSSGRADLDEAVKRIVRVNARYSAFPPAIAAKYDVIEIRRIWRFDETLTLVEEAQ
jgi:TolA protein